MRSTAPSPSPNRAHSTYAGRPVSAARTTTTELNADEGRCSAARKNGVATPSGTVVIVQNATPDRPDMKDEYYRRICEPGTANQDEARLRATITKLKKTIDAKNKELARLREDVPALVRAVNQLTRGKPAAPRRPR